MGFQLIVPKGSQFALGGTIFEGGEHYIENDALWADVVSSVQAGVPIRARHLAPEAPPVEIPEPILAEEAVVTGTAEAKAAVGNEFPQPEEFTPEAPLTTADLKKVGGARQSSTKK